MNEDRPLDTHSLLEQIDVCRPGDVDLRDPLLAALAARLTADPQTKTLYDRVQRMDDAMSQAMHDVPAPPGLEARILAKLAAAEAAALPPAVVAAVTSTDCQTPGPKATPSRTLASSSRRRWLWGAVAAVACAACVAVAVNAWMFGTPPITEAGLALDAVAFYKSEGLAEVRDIPLSAALKSHPFAKSVARPANTNSRRLKAFLGRPGVNGVAYDMSAGAVAATLYVVPLPRGVVLPSSPPMKPATTGGCAAGAWQADGFMYVLVVEGQEGAYQSFLNRMPLA